MRVNEALARVADGENILLHLKYYDMLGYKHEIMRDCRYVNEHIGDWFVTDICVDKLIPTEPVLRITAFKPSAKKVKA